MKCALMYTPNKIGVYAPPKPPDEYLKINTKRAPVARRGKTKLNIRASTARRKGEFYHDLQDHRKVSPLRART